MRSILSGLTVCVLAAGAMHCSSPSTSDAGIDATTPDVPHTMDASDASTLPHCPGPFTAPTARELAVRHRLGIPDTAGCAMLLAQTSHMDIDWLQTFDGYYSSLVENILTSASQLLAADPHYQYQIAEMAFLAEHLRHHPEQTTIFHDAAVRGSLHIVGGAMTSPDTLLPTSEALIRDFLRGSVFVSNTLGATPHAAWLPDSFGHSPTVPDLLVGMGYDAVAFARVDGLHDLVEGIRHQPTLVAGSTASMLTDMHTNDFIWRGPGGGEVLAHWMPFKLYCEGDNIDHDGLPQNGVFFGGHDMGDDANYTNGQIAGFANELNAYARTPYLFVPVGCDFQAPKPRLAGFAQRWNDTMYATTGIYVATASFEDYVDLLADRHGDLPTLQRDIAPYFSGYLGSRLGVKSRIRDAGELLGQAEITAVFANALASRPYPGDAFGAAWDLFARSDHHDFIAGTALDAVTTGEQGPLMDGVRTTATGLMNDALGALATAVPTAPSSSASVLVLGTTGGVGPREVIVPVTLAAGIAQNLTADVPTQVLSATRASDGTLTSAQVLLSVPAVAPLTYQRVALRAGAAATGPVSLTDDGTTVTLRDTSTGLVATVDHATGLLQSLQDGTTNWLASPSLAIESWTDQGGLYRIGSETSSCNFTNTGAVGGTVTVTVVESGPARARVRVARGGVTLVLGMTAGMHRLDIDVDATAMAGQSLTLRVNSSAAGATGTFAQAAGSIDRPAQYLYTPTFWPTVRGADFHHADGSGLALIPRVSTGVHYDATGVIDVMVSRDATSEVCDSLGAMGTEVLQRTLSFSLRPHATAVDLVAEDMALLDAPAVQLTRATASAAATGALVTLGGSGYVVSAVKPADRGAGTLVRVERTGTGSLSIAPALVTGSFTRTDLLERDGAAATSPITLDAPFVTVRVH